MKAWQVGRLGEPAEVMELVEAADPEPGPGQLVVRVLAAPANFPDVLMCRGAYQVRPDLPFTPGIELCGEVVALGPGTDGFAIGDRVLGAAVLPYGGFGEYMTGPQQSLVILPDNVSFEQAGRFGYIGTSYGALRMADAGPGTVGLIDGVTGT